VFRLSQLSEIVLEIRIYVDERRLGTYMVNTKLNILYTVCPNVCISNGVLNF